MKTVFRSSLPILLIGTIAMLLVWITNTSTSFAGVFPLLILLAAAILGLVAGVRRWKRLPVLPFAGIAVAACGYAFDNSFLMNLGFFAFAVMTAWQNHQLEKRQTQTSSKA